MLPVEVSYPNNSYRKGLDKTCVTFLGLRARFKNRAFLSLLESANAQITNISLIQSQLFLHKRVREQFLLISDPPNRFERSNPIPLLRTIQVPS